MLRILIGALVGGVMLFVWGFVSWVILDWHKTSGFQLPDEEEVVEALQDSETRDGVYWVPAPEHRPPLANHADPVAGTLRFIEEQAAFLDEACEDIGARRMIEEEIDWARQFGAVEGGPIEVAPASSSR